MTHDFECPYCGDIFDHAEEFFFSPAAEQADVDCDCGKTFVITRTVTVSYDARK